jgi:hypothetical protein
VASVVLPTPPLAAASVMVFTEGLLDG